MSEKTLHTLKKSINIGFFILQFLFFLLLWTRIHPIMVADSDDWSYVSFSRHALPAFGEWNPAKIFPETVMGLIGNFGMYIFLPVINDWSKTITFVYALFISAVVVIYTLSFDRYINKKFDLSLSKRLFTDFFFIVAHFLIFKTLNSNNPYVFMSHSINTEMNYRVPMMISAALLFYLMENKKDYSYTKKGIILMLTYMMIFSNIATNVVIVIPVTLKLIWDFFNEKKKDGFTVKNFFSTHHYHVTVIIMDIVCLFYEFFGARAASLPFDLRTAIKETITDFQSVLYQTNKLFCLVLIIFVIVAIAINKKYKKTDANKTLIDYMIYTILCTAYVVLLFARVGGHRLTRCDSFSVMYIFLIIGGAVGLASILEKTDKVKIFIPVITYILLFAALNANENYGNSFEHGGDLYLGTHFGYENDKDCYDVNKRIVEAFKKADEEGLDEVTVTVPGFLAKYEFTAGRIETTLFRHGIIRKHMKVNMVEDPNFSD